MQLGGWVQKLEERPHALGPGRFVVFGAFDALVMQVLAEPPAFLHQRVAQHFYVVHNARAFARADVEPDVRARFRHAGMCETDYDAMVPPNGGRQGRDLSKDFRHAETEIEADEAAERRTANSSAGRASL